MSRNSDPIVVVKVGGSVLTSDEAYARVAASLKARQRDERLVVIVSAAFGETDRLLALASGIIDPPPQDALDLLWSIGETRSVALLTLHLRALGGSARGLSVHETGLFLPDGERDVRHAEVNPLRLRSALATSRIVVVPGFLARGPQDLIVSLGRGGSDLSAVLLATAIGARRCELVKDVPGYFDRDPHLHADAVFLPHVPVQRAIEMTDAGCDLVQREALQTAARERLPIVVRSLSDASRQTLVHVDEVGPGLKEVA
jgi:aspartate kinase